MAITINNGYSNNYYNIATNSANQAFDQISNMNFSNATDIELMNACMEFETYFIEQMYKSMEATIMKSEDENTGSSYENVFSDMRIQAYAESATNSGGVGLAKQLYEQMKLNYPNSL